MTSTSPAHEPTGPYPKPGQVWSAPHDRTWPGHLLLLSVGPEDVIAVRRTDVGTPATFWHTSPAEEVHTTVTQLRSDATLVDERETDRYWARTLDRRRQRRSALFRASWWLGWKTLLALSAVLLLALPPAWFLLFLSLGAAACLKLGFASIDRTTGDPRPPRTWQVTRGATEGAFAALAVAALAAALVLGLLPWWLAGHHLSTPDDVARVLTAAIDAPTALIDVAGAQRSAVIVTALIASGVLLVGIGALLTIRLGKSLAKSITQVRRLAADSGTEAPGVSATPHGDDGPLVAAPALFPTRWELLDEERWPAPALPTTAEVAQLPTHLREHAESAQAACTAILQRRFELPFAVVEPTRSVAEHTGLVCRNWLLLAEHLRDVAGVDGSPSPTQDAHTTLATLAQTAQQLLAEAHQPQLRALSNSSRYVDSRFRRSNLDLTRPTAAVDDPAGSYNNEDSSK